MLRIRLLLCSVILLLGSPLSSETSVTAAPGEPLLAKFWRDAQNNLRCAIDLSTRVEYKGVNQEFFFTQFVGIDLHKIFTLNDRDLGVAVVQLYGTRIDFPSPMRPFFFDDSHETKLIPRIVTFNLTGIPGTDGRFNIKVGHFEIPFGHEFLIDTNGTLHDVMHMRNLGVKADYGVTLNGVCDSFDYEVGFSRGSGVDYTSTGNPWLVSGRVGTDVTDLLKVGVSGFIGEVLSPPGVMLYKSGLTPAQAASDTRGSKGVIRRDRIGLDLQWTVAAFNLVLDATWGRDFDQELSNNLLEVNWRSGMEEWLVYAQLLSFSQNFSTGWDHATEGKLGVQWVPGSHWDLSAEYRQQLSNFGDKTTHESIVGQARVRF